MRHASRPGGADRELPNPLSSPAVCMLRSLSKSSRIPLVRAGSRSLAVRPQRSLAWAILPRMGARAAELCPRAQVYGLSGPVARYIGRNGPNPAPLCQRGRHPGCLAGGPGGHACGRAPLLLRLRRALHGPGKACPNLLREAASHRGALEPCVREMRWQELSLPACTT